MLAVIVSLVVTCTSVAVPVVLRLIASTPTTISNVATVATREAANTPTSADWSTFESWDGGFQFDMPGVIGSSHGYFINDFSGFGANYSYTGAPLTTPLQRREAELSMSILFSTKIADRNICPQGGAAVMIGSGSDRIPAWVRDEGQTVVLNLVLNGRAIQITLGSRDNTQPVLAQYGDIWRHMLATFAPLPGVQPLTTQPCG
jgi:hypothetical protein